MADAGPGPLAGLRVLDLSTFLSAPLVSAMLADLGADVIKVEPPEGEPLRRMGAQRHGHSLMWALANRNKRGISLDLGRSRGQQLLRRLAGSVDVVVENQPLELLERWSCTPTQLLERHPALVVVSVSCYGRSGPYAGRAGAGSLAEAFAGLSFMIGDESGPPLLPSVPLGDTITAFSGVIGALAACYHRDARGGVGQHVDVSMYEPVLQVLASTIAGYQPGGPVPSRTGSRLPGGVPRNVYRTADGQWVVVSGTTDAQAGRVLQLLGEDSPEGRDRFGRSDNRLAHAEELDGKVAHWVAGLARHDVLSRLLEARIPAAPVNDVPAILADPHIAARGDVVTLPDPQLGPVAMVGPMPRLSATPAAVRTTGPTVGADNWAVYRDLLGLRGDEIERLVADGVI